MVINYARHAFASFYNLIFPLLFSFALFFMLSPLSKHLEKSSLKQI